MVMRERVKRAEEPLVSKVDGKLWKEALRTSLLPEISPAFSLTGKEREVLEAFCLFFKVSQSFLKKAKL